MMWGSSKENGIWIAPSRRFAKNKFKILFGGDTLIYLAIGRLRVRIMNPIAA